MKKKNVMLLCNIIKKIVVKLSFSIGILTKKISKEIVIVSIYIYIFRQMKAIIVMLILIYH